MGITDASGRVIAHTFDELGDPLCGPSFKRAKRENFLKGVQRAEANARLLAASWDLLEALEGLMFAIAPDMDAVAKPSLEPFFVEPFEKGRAAIAKAKGETP